MKKRLNQLCIVSMGLFLFTALTTKAVSVAPGDTFTATAACGNIEGSVNVSASNASLISNDNWCDRGKTLTATAKAGGVGTAAVTFMTGDATDVAEMKDASGVTLGSTTVNVVAPVSPPDNSGGNTGNGNQSGSGDNTPSYNTPTYETPDINQETPEEPKSSNADLKSLSISKGTLSPEFSSDKTNYTVVLEKDVTSLTVQAVAQDETATVSGTGEISLKPGNNEITISVTAEDGTVKKYMIKAMVDESPDVFIQYNGKKLGVVKNTGDVQIPDTFEKTMVSLEGKNVEAWHSNLSNLTIIYMIDDKNEKNFYLYDESSKMITSLYKPIALLGRQVAIIDIPKELQTRAGMLFGEVEVDSLKFSGWKFQDKAFENYVLLYLMDDKGKMHYYLYEKSENTLQLYSDQAAVKQTDYDQLNEDMKLRMIVLIVLAGTNVLTLVLLLLVLILKKKKRKAVIEPISKKPKKARETKHEEKLDEEIEPFDSWKYEPMNTEHTLHMKPYDDEQHLFDENEDELNG